MMMHRMGATLPARFLLGLCAGALFISGCIFKEPPARLHPLGYEDGDVGSIDIVEYDAQTSCNNNEECTKPAPEHHITPICDSKKCNYPCAKGYGDCDNNLDNGCETDLHESVEHCGRCGNPCETDDTHYAQICSKAPSKNDRGNIEPDLYECIYDIPHCVSGFVFDDVEGCVPE